MRFSKTLAAIILCAATLTLPPAARAAAALRPAQKARASKAQTPAPHTEITKEKLEAIISALEEAAKKRNFNAVVPYLAPDFKFKSDGGGQPTRHANRAQYILMMKLASEITLDYKYLRKSLTITIAPDGQSATVYIEAFEMLTLAQGTVAGDSAGVSTFKIYKGKILLSAMEGKVNYV
jgi:hypothetical protein